MIVECSHCQTKFNLPDDKVKPGGVKIRCTRCKNVFDVSPPAENPAIDDSFSAGLDDDLSGFDEGDFRSFLGGHARFRYPGRPGWGHRGGQSRSRYGRFGLRPGFRSRRKLRQREDRGFGFSRVRYEDDQRGGRAAADSDFTLEKELDGDLGDLDLSFDDGPAPAGKKAAAEAGSDFDLSFGPETAPASADISPTPAPQPAAPGDIPDDFEIGGDCAAWAARMISVSAILSGSIRSANPSPI